MSTSKDSRTTSSGGSQRYLPKRTKKKQGAVGNICLTPPARLRGLLMSSLGARAPRLAKRLDGEAKLAGCKPCVFPTVPYWDKTSFLPGKKSMSVNSRTLDPNVTCTLQIPPYGFIVHESTNIENDACENQGPQPENQGPQRLPPHARIVISSCCSHDGYHNILSSIWDLRPAPAHQPSKSRGQMPCESIHSARASTLVQGRSELCPPCSTSAQIITEWLSGLIDTKPKLKLDSRGVFVYLELPDKACSGNLGIVRSGLHPD